MTDYISELTRDWLERDGETFVHKRRHDRLGWERTLTPGQGYSEYLLHSPSQLELLKRAYPLARNIVAAMDTPERVCVRLSGSGSFTDGRTIFVATDIFDRNDIEPGRKLDVFLGYTVHEGAHVLYTDFNDREYLEGLDRVSAKWVKHLANIIEDEYIERTIGERKPGLANFLEATKWYVFGKYNEELWKKETEPFIELVNAFLGLVRYPKALTEEVISRYGKYLLQARDILTPYPESTRECNDAALRVFGIFRSFLDDAAKKALSDGAEDEDEDGSDTEPGEAREEKGEGENKGGKELDCDDDTEIEIDLSGSKDPDEGDDAGTGSGGDEDEEGEGDGEEEGPEGKESSPKKITVKIGTPDGSSDGSPASVSARLQRKIDEAIRETLEKEFDKMEDTLRTAAPDAGDADSERTAQALKETAYNAGLVEGVLEEGDSKLVFFRNIEDNRDQYEKAYQTVRPYVNEIHRSIRTHFKEYRLVHRCQKSGKLETRKLADAFLGSRTVYVKRGAVDTDRIAVCVLVDESGSMGSRKSKAARETAVLLNEALSGIPDVELFIYGHTEDQLTSGATELMVYRDNKHHPRYALGNITAQCENRDGLAILETARRVRKQTERPVLMFIISDGSPCANDYYGSAAIEDTRRKVEQVEAMGFIPVQICIEAGYDPKLMFRHYLFLTDISKLAVDLSGTIRDALKQNTRSHIQ